MSILAVTPNGTSDRALKGEALVQVKDTPRELGVRLGSSFLINADIFSYRTARTSRFSVPFLVSFPETDLPFSRARVTDLETGTVHELAPSPPKSPETRYDPLPDRRVIRHRAALHAGDEATRKGTHRPLGGVVSNARISNVSPLRRLESQRDPGKGRGRHRRLMPGRTRPPVIQPGDMTGPSPKT